MENEQHYHGMKTRSRSRSQTPYTANEDLILSGVGEQHHNLIRRELEHSFTPEDSTRSKKILHKLDSHVIIKDDHTLETILEKAENSYNRKIELQQKKTSKTESLSSITLRQTGKRQERQRAKKQILSTNGQGDTKLFASENNNKNKVRAVTVQNDIMNDYSSEEGNVNDHSEKPKSAHEFYSRVGEWWNVFPKTDYTYSSVSQCRYEVAPGILAMPNMSRRSLHCSENDTFNSSQSSRINEADITNNTLATRSSRSNNIIENRSIYTEQHNNIYLTERYKSATNLSSENDYFVGVTFKLKNVQRIIGHSFQYIYLFLLNIMLLDTWLLSRISSERRRTSKTTRIAWIVLGPIFLLIGYLGLSCLPYFLQWKEELTRKGSLQYNQDLKNYSPINGNSELFDSIVKRLEVLEHSQISNDTENLQKTMHVLKEFADSEDEKWRQFEERLGNIQKKLDSDDYTKKHQLIINDMKLEMQALRELHEKSKQCCNSQSEFSLFKKLEEFVRIHLDNYFDSTNFKEELNQLMENLAQKDKIKAKMTYHNDNDKILQRGRTDDHIHQIVKEMIRIYDADKTGRVDYALESAGGQIISTRCTQMYSKSKAFQLLGFTLYHEGDDPRIVIQGNQMQPGACWAFQDFPGYLLVKLRSLVYVTGFTLEHAPRIILPNTEMKSAPKKFDVWGLVNENDSEPALFGTYEFVDSDENLQYFPVQNAQNRPYEYVELRIHSNHGQLEYTCLYRFRVHGNPVQDSAQW